MPITEMAQHRKKNMDQWIGDGLKDMSGATAVDFGSLVISLLLSFGLSLILAKLYTKTHQGYSYSKSFVHTIVFVAITIDLIMIIIGSNIARAFALVGAMSIVRFRNPIKDSRDLIFVFMSMAVGMATGTQFFAFAIFFTAFASVVMLSFKYFNFGEAEVQATVIRIKSPETQVEKLQDICKKMSRNTSLISIDSSGDASGYHDIVMELELLRKHEVGDLISKLLAASDDITVNVLVGESSVSV